MKASASGIPKTARQEIVERIHGQAVADPYRWLEDAQKPEVQAWMTEQDRVTRNALGARPERAAVLDRLKQLTYIDSANVPFRRGGRFFYEGKPKNREKGIWYWRATLDGPDQILLDPQTLSAEGMISIGTIFPTWDGKTVAFSVHERGADDATLKVIDVATGRESTIDQIPGARYASPQWLPDGSGFYYAGLPVDAAIPVDQIPGQVEIRFHRRGTNFRQDQVIYPKTGDPTHFLNVSLSRDGRWLLVFDSRGWTASNIYFRDLRDPQATFKPLVVGRDALFEVIIYRDQFFIKTDEGAPRGRIFRCDPVNPQREKWVEIVPEAKEAMIEEWALIGGRLLVNYTRNAANELRIFERDGRPVGPVALPGIGKVKELSGEPDDPEGFFKFGSFTDAGQILRLTMADGKTTPWKKIEAPFDPNAFAVEQVWYTSKDKTRLPMFLVHRKDMKRDGSNPTMMYGYGGFAVNIVPDFSPLVVAWCEQGGVYVATNLRGGAEFGEEWHRAGMREKKQNSFDDFFAAAEWLIANRITSAPKLGVRGGSNGGLLIGASLTQRPELFGAAICAVPLLDMVRYHKFGAGRTWIDEYGSADDPQQFKTLFAYSPYHHVKKGSRFPAVLMLSADNDDRVDPMHARKFVAALQASQAAPRPVLLRIQKNAGHSGADLRRERVEEQVDSLAFLIWQLNAH